MRERPPIAIFAQSGAKASYLADLATRAGFEPQIASDAGKTSFLLAENHLPAGYIATKNGQAILLQPGPSGAASESVRVIKTPAKASIILSHLKAMHPDNGGTADIISLPSGTLDLRESLWTNAGKTPLRLTEKEVAILSFLAERKGVPVSREDLLAHVWSYAEGVETHTLETHIYRLRQKIEADPSSPTILVTKEDGYAIGGDF